jgi:hypothetical protein
MKTREIRKLKKDILQIRNDLVVLDARLINLEEQIQTLAASVVRLCGVVADLSIERAAKPAVPPELAALWQKIRMA